MIEGVSVKKLETHVDERGFFREIIRATDNFFKEGFGQFSVSRMRTGVIKAWHLHNKQVDWWYVHSGLIKVALYDTRKNSKTYKKIMELFMGDSQPAIVLRIPPGVAHGCRCINGPADLFYSTSRVYDPGDELRIAFDDKEIGFNWLKEQE